MAGAKPWRHTIFVTRQPATVCYRKERVERGDGTKTLYFKPAGRNGSDPLLYGGERLADLAEGQHVFIVEGLAHP